VRRRNPNQHSDLVAFRAWKELSIKNRLNLDELNESFRRGIVTHIKREVGSGAGRLASWGGIMFQFKILRERIGESWHEWLPEEKALVRDKIQPVVEFFNQLGDKRDNLA